MNDWLAINKLSLNVKDTKFMIFHPKQKNLPNHQIPNIIIDNQPVERVDSFKFLGVLIDENLTWNKHVNFISNKHSRTCVLSKLKKTCYLEVL